MASKPAKSTKPTVTSESNFVNRALKHLNADEESVVLAIRNTAVSEWEKQIEIIERNIESIKRKLDENLTDQKEYLKEANVKYKESFLNIDIKVKDLDSRKSYIKNEYRLQITKALAAVEAVNDKIKSLQDEAKTQIADLNKQIDNFRMFILEIKD